MESKPAPTACDLQRKVETNWKKTKFFQSFSEPNTNHTIPFFVETICETSEKNITMKKSLVKPIFGESP